MYTRVQATRICDASLPSRRRCALARPSLASGIAESPGHDVGLAESGSLPQSANFRWLLFLGDRFDCNLVRIDFQLAKKSRAVLQ
jgi:hypothetical protein